MFTGVSGSGKSSLVFDTIAAESQRLINETYSTFVQGFMPTLARPEVDVLDGLTTAIIVDQERMGANPRSTVGTATDANAMLRILFSRLGQPHIGPPRRTRSTSPRSAAAARSPSSAAGRRRPSDANSALGGMCPRCEGMGSVTDFDLSALYDDSHVAQRGRAHDPRLQHGRLVRPHLPRQRLLRSGQADRKFTKKELHDLLYKEPTKIKVDGINLTYEGLIPKIQKSFLSKDVEAMQPHIRAFVERAVTFTDLPRVRRHPAQRGGPVLQDQGEEHRRRLRDADQRPGRMGPWSRRAVGGAAARRAAATLDSFVEIGLGYLSLDRPSGTLSGGEAQRTKMIRHLGSVAHRRHLRLRRAHHRPAPPRRPADERPAAAAAGQGQHGAGRGARAGDDRHRRPRRRPRPRRRHGGRRGLLRGHRRRAARQRHDHRPPSRRPGRPQGDGAHADRRLEIRSATTHNLQNVDVDIPLGVLCVVTGVAGSGKSSLIHGSIPAGAGVVAVDQAAIRGSRRSNPATYTGLLDPIRKAFAKANGVKPALFSANSEGACPNCNGAGVIYTDLAMMAGVATTCEECEGKRFQASVLEYTLGGKNISEVLAMSVAEAEEFFGDGEARTPAAHKILDRLADVGLGYLSLGQPLTTLSGGERQRLKLATHMAEKGGVYVLDEPTTGLHLADVEQLLGLLDRLVDSGKSVIVIEHHQAVMAHADWIIDLGPGAGHDGGRIVFEGTPADLVAARSTLTGEHLAAYVGT